MSLYDRLTALQGPRPWGAVLDAGTGRSSLRWLSSLQTTRWTAVTGSQRMAQMAREQAGITPREQDRLIVGNWMDPQLLAGETYDTVVADYLLGAIDGFAPYWQDRLFQRLRPLIGGRLYIIGLEPYVPFSSDDPAGRIVVEIGRLRDACLLLAGQRPYREYPMDWVLRHLEQAGLRTVDVERVPIRYGERFINTQLDLCSESIDKLANRTLAISLQQHIAELRHRALAVNQVEGGLRHGHDYIIAAES